MNFEELARKKKLKIAVVGMGYVGLPLAVKFADAGYNTVGIDIDKERLDLILAGKSYIHDVSSAQLKKVLSKKKFTATNDYGSLRVVDVICICVPTPLDKNKQPDLSYVKYVAREIYSILRKGQMVILESTTYPGTTEEVLLKTFEKNNFKVGKDYFLVFSPERVDPGNKKYKLDAVPKVVGGVTPACTHRAVALYKEVFKSVFPVSSPRVAEMEKLLENIFRNVNIALVNEMAILCRKMDIDIWEVINAAKTKPYGFMAFYPGPGIGGHCIPLDPFYLSWKAKEYAIRTRFIELAGEVNDAMPEYVVSRVQEGMNKKSKSVKGANILVLGVAYKKDIDDMRESPAITIMSLLKKMEANVYFNDPYVSKLVDCDFEVPRIKNLDAKSLKTIDCVVVVTAHSGYDYDKIGKNVGLIVDSRGVVKTKNCTVIGL